LGAVDLAIRDFREAISESPSTANYHHSLGDAFYVSGKYAKARETWGKACEIATTENIWNWQSDLARLQHFLAPIDGECGQSLIDAFESCIKVQCQF
jgi:tetratricopeptide (TPR) repeat protein